MKQEISVNKAISRGQFIVHVPVMLCLIGIPGLALYLSDQNLIPAWGIGIAIIIAVGIAWLIWSLMITKWRIWAFANVRNVHELKKRAIREKLIWEDGSIFGRTEIRNSSDKQKLAQIEKRFGKEDVYKEDYSLAPQTIIKNSKVMGVFNLTMALFIVGMGIYLITGATSQDNIYGAIMCLIGIYGAVKGFRIIRNDEPQIIIDKNGIKTSTTEFKNWSVIDGEEVIIEGYGKSAKSYLVYWYDEEMSEKIEIEQLNVSHQQLENMIRTYRIRNTKNSR